MDQRSVPCPAQPTACHPEHFSSDPRRPSVRAYDRAGIPSEVQPSRATVYRMVEAMDVDYVILGRYTFDGRSFTATAQPLQMLHRKLLPEVTETGGLIDLINIETALAWDLLHTIEPSVPIDRQSFINGVPSVRLDAFENYIRGITTGTNAGNNSSPPRSCSPEPVVHRGLAPPGPRFFDERQYDETISALSHVPSHGSGRR